MVLPSLSLMVYHLAIWVLQTISRINSQIRLGVTNAYLVPFYLISSVGTRGRKCYGIKLEGRKIVGSEVGG
jgi:hypothetical protein